MVTISKTHGWWKTTNQGLVNKFSPACCSAGVWGRGVSIKSCRPWWFSSAHKNHHLRVDAQHSFNVSKAPDLRATEIMKKKTNFHLMIRYMPCHLAVVWWHMKAVLKTFYSLFFTSFILLFTLPPTSSEINSLATVSIHTCLRQMTCTFH